MVGDRDSRAVAVRLLGDAVAVARRVIETRTHSDGAGALVDDREFEIAGDSCGRADADDQVGRRGIEREILRALRRDIDAELGKVDSRPAVVEAELREHIRGRRSVG